MNYGNIVSHLKKMSEMSRSSNTDSLNKAQSKTLLI